MSESIYNLVPREYVAPSKPPMHRSIHDPNLPVTGSTFGKFPNTAKPDFQCLNEYISFQVVRGPLGL